jgi:hypothetical protein
MLSQSLKSSQFYISLAFTHIKASHPKWSIFLTVNTAPNSKDGTHTEKFIVVFGKRYYDVQVFIREIKEFGNKFFFKERGLEGPPPP